jgi:hypothetical protein
MLDYLHEFKEVTFDCLTFFPDYGNDGLKIEAQRYKDPGEKLGGSEMGDEYHIVLFKEDEECFFDLDHFEAVLSDPLEYVSQLIPCGFFGMVSKKTTTSTVFIEKSLDLIKKAM